MPAKQKPLDPPVPPPRPVHCVRADYGFEYSDEEPEEEDVDVENQYYNSKGAGRGDMQLGPAASAFPPPTPWDAGVPCCRSCHCCVCAGMLEGDDFQEALDGFRQVLTMEQDKGEW